jgi:hypothetical protein
MNFDHLTVTVLAAAGAYAIAAALLTMLPGPVRPRHGDRDRDGR